MTLSTRLWKLPKSTSKKKNIYNIFLINMTQSCQIKQKYTFHLHPAFTWMTLVFPNLLSFCLLRKPLLIRSTAFICNIDRDWMIYRKHPIISLLTSMLRKAIKTSKNACIIRSECTVHIAHIYYCVSKLSKFGAYLYAVNDNPVVYINKFLLIYSVKYANTQLIWSSVTYINVYLICYK
jgi:hypothetical protein